MQSIDTSGFSNEPGVVKYDLGLNLKRKSDFNSYGYYADEERELGKEESPMLSEVDFEARIQPKTTSENYLQSEGAEEQHTKGKIGHMQEPGATYAGASSRKKSSRMGTKKDAGSTQIVSPGSQDSKKPKLFKNEFITSIGKIELVGSRNEVHFPNFMNQARNVEELSELFDRNQNLKSSRKEMNELANNLREQTRAPNLKNISFKVFNQEKDFRNMTFNHFIDVTADVDCESNEVSVKADEQKNWSNVRAFGTGFNHGIMGDPMDTNNTVNFLITNNSANNMTINASVSGENGGIPSRLSHTKSPSDFQTQSEWFVICRCVE